MNQSVIMHPSIGLAHVRDGLALALTGMVPLNGGDWRN